MGYGPLGRKESDATEVTWHNLVLLNARHSAVSQQTALYGVIYENKKHFMLRESSRGEICCIIEFQ